MREFKNLLEAYKSLNNKNYKREYISRCCKDKLISYAGFVWRFGSDFDKIPKKIEVRNYSPFVPILQFDINGLFIKEWASVKFASNELNISDSGISNCCKNKMKSAGNFMWKYRSDFDKIPKKINPLDKYDKIIQYSLEGKFIKLWDRLIDIERELKINSGTVIQSCKHEHKSAGNFQWRYKTTKNIIKKIKPFVYRFKKVLQYDGNGRFIKEWVTTVEIEKKLGIGADVIRICCNGISVSSGGYIWRWKINDEIPKNIGKHKITIVNKPVLQYSLEGKFLKLWSSATEAANVLNLCNKKISACCCRKERKTTEGFIWKFKENNKFPKKIGVW